MKNVIITVGAPGSGKSTWIKKYKTTNPHVTVLSSDDLRAVFGKDENDQSVSGRVFEHMENEVDRLLREGKDVCIDATNMHRKARKPWVNLAAMHNAHLIAYVFIVDRDILIERNQKRGASGGRNVPVDVIDRMLNNYVVPSKEEAIDEVKFV
jgi:predicted kinase